jgi:hypothetical protein
LKEDLEMKISRRLSVLALSAVLFTSLTGFGLPSIPGVGGGSGGGGKWTQIVKDWKGGLSGLAKESARLGYAQADLAEALGLKQEAALMRGQAKNLEKSGDSLGGSELKEFGKNSVATQAAINDKIKSTAKLSADQKAAMAQAGVKVSKSLVGVGKGVFLLVKASVAAASAGAPGVSDLAAAPIAAQIPVLIPDAAAVIPKIWDVSNGFRKIAEEKDVAMPEMPAAPNFG